jgi:hypothetical protein
MKHFYSINQSISSINKHDVNLNHMFSPIFFLFFWRLHLIASIFAKDCCDDGTLERSILHQTSASLEPAPAENGVCLNGADIHVYPTYAQKLSSDVRV